MKNSAGLSLTNHIYWTIYALWTSFYFVALVQYWSFTAQTAFLGSYLVISFMTFRYRKSVTGEPKVLQRAYAAFEAEGYPPLANELAELIER